MHCVHDNAIESLRESSVMPRLYPIFPPSNVRRISELCLCPWSNHCILHGRPRLCEQIYHFLLPGCRFIMSFNTNVNVCANCLSLCIFHRLCSMVVLVVAFEWALIHFEKGPRLMRLMCLMGKALFSCDFESFHFEVSMLGTWVHVYTVRFSTSEWFDIL